MPTSQLLQFQHIAYLLIKIIYISKPKYLIILIITHIMGLLQSTLKLSPLNQHIHSNSIQQKKISEQHSHNPSKQSKEMIDSPSQQLLNKINQIYFHKFNNDERNVIYKLIIDWSEIIDINQSIITFRQQQFLSARVYAKAVKHLNQLKYKLSKQEKDSKLLIFLKNNTFSYNRYFWQPKIQSKYGSNQSRQESQVDKNSYFKESYEIIKQSNHKELINLFQIMIQINLVEQSSINNTISNIFLNKLDTIKTIDQKIIYLTSMKLQFLQKMINKQENNKFASIIKQYLPNYGFYLNITNKNNVKYIHGKQKDYKFLQNRHDYIQHLFPNHYQSAFNQNASPLNYLEKQLFIQDQIIGQNMLKSVKIFFDFMGIQVDFNTLQLKLTSRQRLKDCLIKNTHNHLRIMRIFACLSVIGFRPIALKLLKFIEQCEFFPKLESVYKYDWQIYGTKQQKKARQMCFLENSDFPKPHIVFQNEQLLSKLMGKSEISQQFKVKEKVSKLKDNISQDSQNQVIEKVALTIQSQQKKETQK